MNRKWLCLTLCLAGSGCTTSDPACNASNCQALIEGCHSILPGETDTTCLNLIVDQDALAEWSDAGFQSCIDACNEDQQGALLSCVAQKFPGNTCVQIALDGGDETDAVGAACLPPPGACDASCLSCRAQCGQAQQACNLGCADGGAWSACLACNLDCNQQLVKCEGACSGN